MFGYPRAELVASQSMLIPERFRAGTPACAKPYARIRRARAMGAGRELFARRKDGSEFPVEVALARCDRRRGVRAGFGRRHHRAQDARAGTARQRDELAHLSRVAMLGELSGSLAHELNQPLTAILSNAQAAQRFLAQSPPRVDKLAGDPVDIVKSDHRARAVIQRLRSMLRKEEAQRHRSTSTTSSRNRCG